MDEHLETDGYSKYDLASFAEGKARCKAALQKASDPPRALLLMLGGAGWRRRLAARARPCLSTLSCCWAICIHAGAGAACEPQHPPVWLHRPAGLPEGQCQVLRRSERGAGGVAGEGACRPKEWGIVKAASAAPVSFPPRLALSVLTTGCGPDPRQLRLAYERGLPAGHAGERARGPGDRAQVREETRFVW